MKKRIGIDLGTNSIGWAIRLINEKLENQIIDKGVLLFDKGVASDKGNEYPKVQKRTESRGVRRNYQAEKYRKYGILETLIVSNMCPLTIEELDDWRKYKKGKKRKYPKSKEFLNWLQYDFDADGKPDFYLFDADKHESNYIFRALCIDEKYQSVFKNNPHILGRVLYQLAQRRGFRGRDEKEAKTILEGSPKTGTKGRGDITTYIKKHKTLGAALYYYQKENGGRIRNRYNLRKDFQNELEAICNFYDFNEELKNKLHKYIIWQRPLRTQKGLIGFCTYEKNKKRVSISHPWYQEYKTWVFINNLKIIAPENKEQVEYLTDEIYPIFIRKSDFEVEKIIDKVLKDGGQFLSNYNTKKLRKTKVVALKNFYDFEKLFGENWKANLSFNNINEREHQPSKKEKKEYTIEDIWHVLYTFDSKDKLIEFALNKLNLTEEKAKKFSNISLDNGYSTLSLSAVKKILPYLKKGLKYSDAVYLANLYKVLGQNNIEDEFIDYFTDKISVIEKKVTELKKLNSIVNSLIKNHLEEDDRYFIENNRDLDESELNHIKSKTIELIGSYSWDKLTDKEKDYYVDYISENFKNFLKKKITDSKNIFLKQPRLHKEIFNVLQERFNLEDNRIHYLWHPSEQEDYNEAEFHHQVSHNNQTKYISDNYLNTFLAKNPTAEIENYSLKLLGSPEPLKKGFKNPMALKTLHKLKQLLNYLLIHNKIDIETEVIVEIARELNNNNMRAAIKKYQDNREKENEKFKEQIAEINKECRTDFDVNNKTLLQKMFLWQEQNKKCLYTGKTISCKDVLDGNMFDLEHTIPASISFDSRLENLTLADTTFNRQIKGNRIPFELEEYYKDILNNISFMKDKIEKLKVDIKDNVNTCGVIQDKGRKDELIQKRHLLKFDLKYWKEKYSTFTTKEFKLGWRNSQLKDTQIVTKYALPYLKTVFKRVSVEKGLTVNYFKEIYKVKIDKEKDRSEHSHHAIDAAILTLIPNSYDREKILEKYFEAKYHKKKYHQKPKNWKNFKPSQIISIKNKVLANNLIDDRKLTPTFKKVRKRGKIQYKTELKKEPKIATGDTIRGQLHKESFFGAIKHPKKQDGKILFDENNNMVLDDEIKLVIRKPLKYKANATDDGFKNLSEIEKVIVDVSLFKMIKKQVDEFDSFKEAMNNDNGIYVLDKKGNKVNQIKKIRCRVKSGPGFLKFDGALNIKKHEFKSKKNYKRSIYAENAENAYCFLYEFKIGDRLERTMKVINLFELSKLKIKNIQDLFEIPYYKQIKVKNKIFNLIGIVKSGDKFIFFKENKNELLELDKEGILKRLYKAYVFESDTNRIRFKHHLIAGEMTKVKKQYKENTDPKFIDYEPILRLTQAKWNFAIENIDFKVSIDGTIHWLI